MKLQRFAISLLAVIGAGLLPPGNAVTASAQQAKSNGAAANVVIGTVASEVGTTAAIPLYFQPAKNSNVRSLHLEIDFVSNSIKFAKAEKGVATEGRNYDVTVESKELPPDDKKLLHTRLNIDISIPDSDSKQTLPEGLLAFLNFAIPENAKPFSISLTPITTGGQDASKKPVEVAAEAGKVIVSIPDAPLAGCFFFSH